MKYVHINSIQRSTAVFVYDFQFSEDGMKLGLTMMDQKCLLQEDEKFLKF